MTKKGQIQAPAEVFECGLRHKDFAEHMQTGHSVPDNDGDFRSFSTGWIRSREQKT
ncbi:hypothetical protein C7476_1389 [Phyllobacterium bourgognense]|uniref:Uncharacterized protein n=1 Tax=Phyllobacterium bourgognense TaxID=314236 RepID=A0A368YCA1_9HYPH|nr:hypothetical protein C7476_1389 [Phyllobacterium bourgognense]